MNTNIYEGDPAFPNPSREFVDPHDQGMRERISKHSSGMSLRDYFASKALNGMLAEGAMVRMGAAAKECKDCPDDANEVKVHIAQCLASSAYIFADAMLKARNAQ